jgi:hypothetical protein
MNTSREVWSEGLSAPCSPTPLSLRMVDGMRELRTRPGVPTRAAFAQDAPTRLSVLFDANTTRKADLR